MSDSAADAANQQLLDAAKAGDVERTLAALEAGADPGYQEEAEGLTPLMAAAEAGSADGVSLLLQAGAPWQAQDKEGYTAGEYASGSGHSAILQQLLDHAVRAELLLGTISRRERKGPEAGTVSRDYLSGSLRYEDGQLIDAEGEGVMMGWETPLMEKHAEIICRSKGDVLNVGFGLGIVDGFIQQHQPRSHTIIEAHPDVYKHMLSLGWDKLPGVRLVFGRWQDVVGELGPFDGIFWDTYAEFYEDMHDFHSHLPRLLKPGGVYSFFNGLAPDNIFFHLVYGEIARLELGRLGLSTTYDAMRMDASDDAIWQGVKNRYWHLPVYFVPTCIMGSDEEAGAEVRPGAEAVAATTAESGMDGEGLGRPGGTAVAAADELVHQQQQDGGVS